MKWDTLKIDDQFYWSWIFIVSDFISRIFHQYWCQNWRPIPLVVDFHSIRFHFTNFFIDFQKTNENLFSWLLLVKMNIMIFWNNVISNNFSKKEILTLAKMFPCCSQFCWWLSLWNKPGSKLSSNLEARWAFLLWFSPYLRCDLWFAWGATLTPTLLWLLSSYYRQPGWSPWLLEPLKKK